MVVWIEILQSTYGLITRAVTTCVVVWIEIVETQDAVGILDVTTCVVVWIEIIKYPKFGTPLCGHHLRGGVD